MAKKISSNKRTTTGRSSKAKAKPAAAVAVKADPVKAKQSQASKRIVGRFIQLAINNGPTTLDAIAKKVGCDVDRVKHHITNFCNARKPRVAVDKSGNVKLTGEPIAMRKTADAIGEKFGVDVVTPKFAVVKK